MTAGTLRYTLVVRHPDTHVATALLAGETVPAWASDLVHSDDKSAGEATSKPAAGDEAPAGNASREAWAAYATSKGAPGSETADVTDGGLSRDDLRQKYAPKD